MKIFQSFLLILFASTLFSQVSIDSTYTYGELNQMLSKARKGSTTESKKELGVIYYLLGKYEHENFNNSGEALKYFTRAKDYFEIIKDTALVYEVELLFADRYSLIGMYQEAIEKYNYSLEYYINQNNLFQITHINNELSKVYLEKGDSEMALDYANKAITLNKQLKDTLLSVGFLIDKINAYVNINELDSALMLSFQAFKLSDEIQDNTSISRSLYQIGYLNKLKSDYAKAIKYLLDSEAYVVRKPYDEDRKRIYEQLSICYSNINDFKNAYKYNQLYAELSDSIMDKQRTETITNLTIKHKSQEKNIELENLKIEKNSVQTKNEMQSQVLYLLTAGFFVLLSLLYYIINFYRQKMKADEIITKQKEEINDQKIRELEDNIQISSMQSMLEGQEIERERIAKDLHDSLGGLLSTIKLQFDSVQSKNKSIKDLSEYNNANKMLDTAVAEVRSISQNLQPGALVKLGLIAALRDLFNRFDDEMYPDIDFQHYQVPEKMDTMVSLSIYRIIQELLYNTIKHAKATEVLIQINRSDDELVIQYEDDGKGFDINKLKRKGMGLDNIMSRVNYLKGQINFDAKEGEGMSVLIQHLKYNQAN